VRRRRPVLQQRNQKFMQGQAAKDKSTPLSSSGEFILGYPPFQHNEAVVQQKTHLPHVDWTRYHLQVLFIDQSDTLRARLASGLFDRIAEWNGYGRALYAWTCGLHAEEPTTSSSSSLDRLSTQAGLMHKAWMLGIPPKVFARPVEQFELADLDRYDVVVAMDSSVRQQILEAVDPAYTDYYEEKVRLLTEYASPAALADDTVLRLGGTALLPRAMSQQLQPLLEQLRQVVDIQRPELADASEAAVVNWNSMVHSIMLGCAGLVHYLITAYPPDMPHYDPL